MINKYKNSKFYKGWCKLREDLKPMTFGQKVDHLWTYYKIYLWLVFFAMSPVLLLGIYINRQNQEILASGIMVNLPMSPAGMSYMSTDYARDLGATKKNQLAELVYANFGDPLNNQTGIDSYNKSMMLVARVSAKTLDYMLLDKFAMEYYIDQEVYLDLQTFFTKEELDALNAEGKVIWARQEDQEEKWAVAVDISDTAFIQENVGEDTKAYFALSGSSQRLEVCRTTWERINSWQSDQ